MKKIILSIAAFVFALAAMAQSKADSVIKVNTETYNFGKVKQGVPPVYSFEIKNITDKPVVVENTSASCGCTTPEKITEPIAPGATVKLKVQYSAAAAGQFNKDVYIKLAGIEQPKTVHITGEVLTAEAYDTWAKENGNIKEKVKEKDVKATKN